MLVVDSVVKMEENSTRRRPRSASCVALRQAVSQLTRLSDFKTEKIGGGHFADVYKVEHTSTGEVMVLKMNKHRKNSRQMLSEIQLLNKLSHPNILGFRGSCVHEGQLHALTEFINGGTLEELLEQRDVKLSWSAKTKIAKDIAEGMTYLHSNGIFHRDLTSKNCLIQREPNGALRTVVADFGLAATIKDARGRNHTEVVGTPYWMAPECLNGKEYCEKADVFSYGIILAEILAQISADPEIMPRTKQYGVDYENLKKLCIGCPEELWDVMCKCSQIDPNARPTFVTVVLNLGKIHFDNDARSSQSEPAILSDLEDSCGSYGLPSTTDLVQDVVTPTGPTYHHHNHQRWYSENLCGQHPADRVHPPNMAPKVATSEDEEGAGRVVPLHPNHHPPHPAHLPLPQVQDTAIPTQKRERGTAGTTNLLCCSSDSGNCTAPLLPRPPPESDDHADSGDCTPVVCTSPPAGGRRIGNRPLRSGCSLVQSRWLPFIRVQTAPQLSNAIGNSSTSGAPTSTCALPPLPSCHTGQQGVVSPNEVPMGGGGGVGEERVHPPSFHPYIRGDAVCSMGGGSSNSPLLSPDHAPCSPWMSFNPLDPTTPLSALTSPLPPKNFRFSLGLCTGEQRPHDMATTPLQPDRRTDLTSSDYGSGDVGPHSSQSSTPATFHLHHHHHHHHHDSIGLHYLSLEARLKSQSSPSMKPSRGPQQLLPSSATYALPLRSWGSDSSRSSASSFRCYDIVLHRNRTCTSVPNLHVSCLHAST